MKAQGLSMSILVVAAIAVMVLLVLGVFFTGGFRAIGTNMMDFIQGTGGDKASANVTNCNVWCMNNKTGMAQDNPYGCDCT